MYCKNCGARYGIKDKFCPNCGKSTIDDKVFHQDDDTLYQEPDFSYKKKTDKNKILAGVFAIILGGIGVHHFYMGNIGKGILDILFCWTGIPAIVGFIMGIIYIVESDEAFERRLG